MYYRGAAAAIIVFDIMNPASFDRAKKWVQELQAQGNPNMVTALAGNKADLLDARRVTAEMNKNEGSLGSFPEFYKETHYNVKKGKWATPECERLHSEMERDEEWQNSQSDVAPLTAEQMSIKHLRAQSGVVKGIGIRPSSSLQTTAASLQVSDEVVRHLVERAEQELQQKLKEQKRGEMEERVRGEMEEQLQMEREKRLQLEQKLDALLEYMKSGHQVPYPPPDDGSAGCSLGVV